MSFFSLLGSFFIGPLKLIFEAIFEVAYGIVDNPGLAIIFLSLAMNVLVLPLYRRADAMQEQARDTEARLAAGVSHIKKTFSGNERMMMLQAYYRQNDYSPTNALHGSISLLLEIPFFMAAYQFLSHLELLKGVSFGPIADLGAPDGLLTVFGITINVLPVLMTLINFISSAIYLRGFPLKTKIQLYAMAVFFLFFLYTSPSGLVFYWTLNNVFSLLKNIFYKIKNPKLVIAVITALLGAGVLTVYVFTDELGLPSYNRSVVFVLGLALFIPAIAYFIGSRMSKDRKAKEAKPNRRILIGAAAFLSVLTGVLIPSTYIAAEPEEFIDVTHFFHPGWYIANSAALAAGTFLLWIGVFYWLASPRGKVVFERVMLIACAVATVDYIFFGRELGIVSHTLQYDNGMYFSLSEKLVNILVISVLCVVLLFVISKWPKAVAVMLLTMTAAIGVLSGINVSKTVRAVGEITLSGEGSTPHFTLSKTEENVVVIFLDRALGETLPYIVNEKPELKDVYDGFTYYSNVISYGGHTNFGAPALMGGYEYTPVELNKRDTELLVDKHNESLKVMPVLFSQNGYDVTVCDAPYANYKWIPDLSIYDEYPQIKKYVTKGYFSDTGAKEQTVENNKRNFFCFSLMKALPVSLQYVAYDSGNYHRAGSSAEEAASTQVRTGTTVSDGLSSSFMESYEALINMTTMTKVTDDAEKNFVFYYNDLPHEAMMLDEENGYVPAAHVDNTAFDKEHAGRFTVDGKSINVSDERQVIHYQTNMATLIQVGKWLDYLKEEGVYDNTKIIICSDHGYYLYLTEQFGYEDHMFANGFYLDIGNYFPLLMVKDFNAHGFTTDDTFMTNADVPTLACEGSIENTVNPFTGKAINNDEKTAHDQFIISYHAGWDTKTNNGETFLPCPWVVVTNNIWDKNDWQIIDDHIVLKEHKMP